MPGGLDLDHLGAEIRHHRRRRRPRRSSSRSRSPLSPSKMRSLTWLSPWLSRHRGTDAKDEGDAKGAKPSVQRGVILAHRSDTEVVEAAEICCASARGNTISLRAVRCLRACRVSLRPLRSRASIVSLAQSNIHPIRVAVLDDAAGSGAGGECVPITSTSRLASSAMRPRACALARLGVCAVGGGRTTPAGIAIWQGWCMKSPVIARFLATLRADAPR